MSLLLQILSKYNLDVAMICSTFLRDFSSRPPPWTASAWGRARHHCFRVASHYQRSPLVLLPYLMVSCRIFGKFHVHILCHLCIYPSRCYISCFMSETICNSFSSQIGCSCAETIHKKHAHMWYMEIHFTKWKLAVCIRGLFLAESTLKHGMNLWFLLGEQYDSDVTFCWFKQKKKLFCSAT